MRNPYRTRPRQPDDAHQAAGVGELRAVAERLLETGAHFLDQGRAWLHAATRRQAEEEGAYGGQDREGRPHHGGGPYAPDEYSFSETGGVFDRRGGRHDEGPGAYGFEAELDDPLRRRARPGRGRQHRDGRRWDDGFVPGSYGFGGEGRHESGDPPDPPGPSAAGWERAYRAQGQAGYRGHGPRGYMRSDERILEDLCDQLCDDPIVDASDIEVHCDQGRVVLSGRVPTRWMKHRAEDIADAVRGVKDVDNRVRVSAEEPVAQGDFDTRRTTGKDGEDVALGAREATGTAGGRASKPPESARNDQEKKPGFSSPPH